MTESKRKWKLNFCDASLTTVDQYGVRNAVIGVFLVRKAWTWEELLEKINKPKKKNNLKSFNYSIIILYLDMSLKILYVIKDSINFTVGILKINDSMFIKDELSVTINSVLFDLSYSAVYFFEKTMFFLASSNETRRDTWVHAGMTDERVVEKKWIKRVIYTNLYVFKNNLNIYRYYRSLHRTLKGTSNRNYSRARSKHPLSDEVVQMIALIFVFNRM